MDVPNGPTPFAVPPELKCSLSNRLYIDPVTAADGYTYERANILKHLDISLKSPTNGMLLLHTGLVPNTRKQQQAQQWLVKFGEAVYNYASKCSEANRDQEALDMLIHLKDVVGTQSFVDNMEWPYLGVTVAERILMSLTPSSNNPVKPEEAQLRIGPLRLLYDIYLAYYMQDNSCPYKDDFVRVRSELALCYFALGEHGHLEAVLRKHKHFNTAPLWRMLVNEQISFGWKKEAAKACMEMATFAADNGMEALATTAKEEAISLDPNIKPDGTEFASMTFMTKEELRLATREEIVSSFLKDPNNQHYYEHLIDFLEDEGAVVNAVRVIVAHALTKNVPAQFQTEANNARTEKGLEILNPPDLQSLLKQAQHEEEYRPITVTILDTIAKSISPPVLGTAISGVSSVSSSAPTSSTPPSSPISISPQVANIQDRATQRSSWGIKPAQGKDRNKRFTMGIRTQSGMMGSARSADFLSQPATSNITISSLPSDARAHPASGKVPLNFAFGPSVRLAPPHHAENPIFSQPLVPPSRLHTPSTLTPFNPAGEAALALAPFPTSSSTSLPVAEDSPFSTTMFHAMPDQLGSSQSASEVHHLPTVSETSSTTDGASGDEEEPPPPPDMPEDDNDVTHSIATISLQSEPQSSGSRLDSTASNPDSTASNPAKPGLDPTLSGYQPTHFSFVGSSLDSPAGSSISTTSTTSTSTISTSAANYSGPTSIISPTYVTPASANSLLNSSSSSLGSSSSSLSTAPSTTSGFLVGSPSVNLSSSAATNSSFGTNAPPLTSSFGVSQTAPQTTTLSFADSTNSNLNINTSSSAFGSAPSTMPSSTATSASATGFMPLGTNFTMSMSPPPSSVSPTPAYTTTTFPVYSTSPQPGSSSGSSLSAVNALASNTIPISTPASVTSSSTLNTTTLASNSTLYRAQSPLTGPVLSGYVPTTPPAFGVGSGFVNPAISATANPALMNPALLSNPALGMSGSISPVPSSAPPPGGA